MRDSKRARAARQGRKKGQGTLELTVTLLAFFTLLFMFIQMSLSYAVANFIHYATYYGARVLLSGGTGQANQVARATSEMSQTLFNSDQTKFPSVLKDSDFDKVSVVLNGTAMLGTGDARKKSWEDGVKYEFNAKIYMVPFLATPSYVDLVSEAYLGRDPSTEECKSMPVKPDGNGAFYDNGC